MSGEVRSYSRLGFRWGRSCGWREGRGVLGSFCGRFGDKASVQKITDRNIRKRDMGLASSIITSVTSNFIL